MNMPENDLKLFRQKSRNIIIEPLTANLKHHQNITRSLSALHRNITSTSPEHHHQVVLAPAAGELGSLASPDHEKPACIYTSWGRNPGARLAAVRRLPVGADQDVVAGTGSSGPRVFSGCAACPVSCTLDATTILYSNPFSRAVALLTPY